MLRAFWSPLAAALLLSAPAGALTQTEKLGPLRLKGAHRPMAGPRDTRSLLFDADGWLTGVSARVLDATSRPRRDQAVLCHLSLRYGNLSHHQPPVLTLSPGAMRLRLPDGFGMPVSPDAPAVLDAMLQSDEPALDERLTVEAAFDITPRIPGGKTLRPLWHAPLAPSIHDVAHAPGTAAWWAPPGKSARPAVLRVPVTGRLHAVFLHLHHHASRVSLRLADGRVVLEGAVRADARGHLLTVPSYSDAAGLPVTEGDDLALDVDYDNPGDKWLVAMATVHVFIAPERPFEELLSERGAYAPAAAPESHEH